MIRKINRGTGNQEGEMIQDTAKTMDIVIRDLHHQADMFGQLARHGNTEDKREIAKIAAGTFRKMAREYQQAEELRKQEAANGN